MTIPTFYLQKRLYPPMSQDRDKGLDARGTLELIALDSIDFQYRVNRSAGFPRQQFEFRIWRMSR